LSAVGIDFCCSPGWETPANLEKLDNLIDWAHENDLEFHVTEMTVRTRSCNLIKG
jgi:hypothetical protein